MVHSCVPIQAPIDEGHDASVFAAMVASELLSHARLNYKLDTVYTEYSAQYLVDNACSNKQDRRCRNLTVKDCLVFALKEGIPKADQWPHLGCIFKPSPSAYNPSLVSMNGELLETSNVDVALKLLKKQPVAARLHVYSPEIDKLIDPNMEKVFCPPEMSRYVGLRDAIICGVEGKENVAKVKMFYKKKFSCIKVSLDTLVQIPPEIGDFVVEATSEPECLLVDFCVPRLSID